MPRPWESVMTYVVLLRGINVGGRNKVRMADLRERLASVGFDGVQTYIQSGNVLLDSPLAPDQVRARFEDDLPATFDLDSDLVRVLVLPGSRFREVVAQAPDEFGSDPDTYRYDVAFLMDVPVADVMPHVTVNPDVDTAWPGDHAIYYRRLTAQASRSHLNRIVSSPVYGDLTIRNWNTTTRLAAMLDER